MKKSAELNIAIYDAGFASAVETMVREDLAACDVLTKAEWKSRGLVARFGAFFFWLFSENS